MMVGMGSNLNLTCKAVLFDMDGTLLDSGVVVERAWGRLDILVNCAGRMTEFDFLQAPDITATVPGLSKPAQEGK